MITLANNLHCTGCEACFNICPKAAITFLPDKEGFLQPQINQMKCIECHLCENKCPVIHPYHLKNKQKTAYAMISKLDRTKSSSGGAFSVFARYIIRQKGVVYGASMTERNIVKHIRIEDIQDLHLLRGSKYVQSEIGETFKNVKSDLKHKQKVLFVGTPCQVAGLYNYLGKRYDELLITLDLVCHGVPSPLALKMYLKKIQDKYPQYGNIKTFIFRKLDSWSIIPEIQFVKKNLMPIQEDNAYMKIFFHGWSFRECCFNCQYSNLERVGTFTIADFWGIGKYGQSFKKNVSKGVSLVIDNTDSMPVFMNELSLYAYIEKRDLNEALHENHNLKSPFPREPERDYALLDFISEKMSLRDFCRKYHLLDKQNAKFYASLFFKKVIINLGLYNIYKAISYKRK